MRLNLSRLHYPVTTLGPGRRVGVWFQGCSLHCPGCVSVDTWEVGRGETTVEAVLAAMEPWLQEAEGITISGGEPLEQPQALAGLLEKLRVMIRPGADILVYSGYPWEKIADRVVAWAGLADVLISDPYAPKTGQSLVWRGSDNQRMHLLTPLGKARYAEWVAALRTTQPRALDVFFQDGEVWMAGIPGAGSMDAIAARLADEGFSATTSSSSTAGAIRLPVFA